MKKRKFSEEINNFKLEDFNTFNISSEISETPNYVHFVLNQQDDKKTKQ